MCLLVVVLLILPIPLMLAGVNAIWTLGLAAILFMVAGVAGGIIEIIWPISRLRRGFFSLLLLCTFGFIGLWLPGSTAPLLGRVLSLIGFLGLVLGGGAFGFLRSIDQWRERAFYRRLKKDQAEGVVWEFGEFVVRNEELESRFSIAAVLPKSGLVVSLRGNPFPKTEPVLPMAAAPRPALTWEIPSQLPPPQGLRRATRLLTESERTEGMAALTTIKKRTFWAGVGAFFSGSVLYRGALVPRMAHTPEAQVAGLLLAIILPITLAWFMAKRWIRFRRLAKDLEIGKVEVFRHVEAPDEDHPLAEMLPLSRFIWTWQGRLGAIRLSRQKPGVKR